MKTLAFAKDAWKYLNGIVCVYKPPCVHYLQVRNSLAVNLCKDLNEMQSRPTKDFIEIKGSVCSDLPFSVELRPNFADHELVSGPRYQIQDIRLKGISPPGRYTSGITLFTVNDGCKQALNLVSANFLRKYEVKGKFGMASHTFMEDGKIVERTTYSHIRPDRLDRLLASIQSSHQSLAFKYSGVDLQSQEAYELASKGIVRPGVDSGPIIYSIKCIEFNLPEFTLEIHCVNENEEYLAEMIHQIGVYLRSTAVCSQLRRTQYSNFTLDHALLRKHWNLENILSNITLCKNVLFKDQPQSAHFEIVHTAQLKKVLEEMQNDAREDKL